MKTKKMILGLAACFVAIIGNLSYASGGYGNSTKGVRGGTGGTGWTGGTVSCTAVDAFGHQMECNKKSVKTSMTEMCLLYQYTVRVTHHHCSNWKECRKGNCKDCSCAHICHCVNNGNAITLNYYFSSANLSEAYKAAISFKNAMLQDYLNDVDSLYAYDYSLQYVPTDIPVTECRESLNSTCLSETGVCPTLVAS